MSAASVRSVRVWRVWMVWRGRTGGGAPLYSISKYHSCTRNPSNLGKFFYTVMYTMYTN